MTINKTKSGDTLVIVPEGRLDTTTAPELDAELKSSLEGVKSLLIDLEKLEYISSAGLRVLITAQKTMNKQGEMTIVHANRSVMEVFEITGFDRMLNIK